MPTLNARDACRFRARQCSTRAPVGRQVGNLARQVVDLGAEDVRQTHERHVHVETAASGGSLDTTWAKARLDQQRRERLLCRHDDFAVARALVGPARRSE